MIDIGGVPLNRNDNAMEHFYHMIVGWGVIS